MTTKEKPTRPRNWKTGPGCGICRHPDRARIEIARARGVSYEAIAKQFEGVSRDQVWRHWKDHVGDDVKAKLIGGPAKLQELAERATAENMSALDYYAIIRSRLMDQFSAACDAGDVHGSAFTAGKLLSVIGEIGKLTGEIQRISGVTVNNNMVLMQSPQMAELQMMLVTTLASWPDARAAVIAGIRRLEGKAAPSAPANTIEGRAILTCGDADAA
jgi:hypothetical protein